MIARRLLLLAALGLGLSGCGARDDGAVAQHVGVVQQLTTVGELSEQWLHRCLDHGHPLTQVLVLLGMCHSRRRKQPLLTRLDGRRR